MLKKDPAQTLKYLDEKIHNDKTQRRLVLIIVCIALFLDNMLYMVIVPIIPDYLRSINAWGTEPVSVQQRNYTVINTNAKHMSIETHGNHTNTTMSKFPFKLPIYKGNEDSAVGFLFASKALVQLIVNPFTGALIDRIGYDIPMSIGLLVMFLSTATFAFGESYAILFLARSLQGVGSAFADTSGLAMIADRYTVESERSQAMGIALSFISLGCLFAPPFGGVLYEFAGKKVPFVILALVALVDAGLLLLVMRPVRRERAESQEPRTPGTPIWRLLMDPYIAVCAGALAMANVSLAFLEPTIAIWMQDTMDAAEWQIGLVWLPSFFPYVIGVYFTVKFARKYPQYQWVLAVVGLMLEAMMSLIIPFTKSFVALIFPLMGVCAGESLVGTAVLPTLGYLVDVRHVSVYGSVYAIGDISFSIAYAFGPMIAGNIVHNIGFVWLNVGIFVATMAYAPLLLYLRTIFTYKPFENECDVLMDNKPAGGQYHTMNGDAGDVQPGEQTVHIGYDQKGLKGSDYEQPDYQSYLNKQPTNQEPSQTINNDRSDDISGLYNRQGAHAEKRIASQGYDQ